MDVLDLGADIQGEAAELGRLHASIALARLHAGWRGLIVSGGETSVRVRGTGRGGRNSEYLGAVVENLGGVVDIAGLAADTDGVDGSGGAGAWFDPAVLSRAADRGLAVSSFRETSDTHAFFATLGSVLERRPTCTNVNDFRAILVGTSAL
jgi:hydroxypyruvate reductase